MQYAIGYIKWDNNYERIFIAYEDNNYKSLY